MPLTLIASPLAQGLTCISSAEVAAHPTDEDLVVDHDPGLGRRSARVRWLDRMAGVILGAVVATTPAPGQDVPEAATPPSSPPTHQDPLQGPPRPENFVDVRAGELKIEPIRGDHPLPTAGYDKSPVNGAFIQSEDGEFRLQLGGYTQLRYNANFRDAPAAPPDPDFGNEDVTRGGSVNRTRFFLEGKYTDDFAYHFRTNTNDSSDTELLVAWGQWRIDDRWSVRFGKQFIPLSREDWMFAQDILTIEFSPNDFSYAIGTSLGAFVHYGGDQHRFWLALHNGAYGGRDEFPAPESDLAGTARWEWNLHGEDWTVWDDMVGRRGRPSVTMLGLSAAYQEKVTSDVAADSFQRGAQVNADLSFNGDGYQAVVAGSATFRDPESGDAFTNYGLMAQLGYFVGDQHQVYGQYNLLSPGDQPGDLEDFNSLAAGYSFFPFLWTNRWKLSAEVGHLFSALDDTVVEPSGSLGWLPSSSAGQSYLKVQFQVGF